jgi:hypothetical protein
MMNEMKKDGENKNWSFAQIWNQALDVEQDRIYEPRDYLWASELGGSYYDRYWKMKGRKPTTAPNLRSRRKFEGGNLTEWIVQQILKRAGILKSSQEYITYNGELKVTGRADFVAGGQIYFAPHTLNEFPETFQVMAETVIKTLRAKYPDGLREMNLEIKSCSGMMFERYMKAPSPLHGLQAFHYAYNTKRPTMLVYVSRDDFRLVEWLILPGSRKWLKPYLYDIEHMKEILALEEANVPKEPLLVIEDDHFTKNWKVEYSNYLTDYGYKHSYQFAKVASKAARRLNNIVKKIKADKPIDGKVNVATLKECYSFFPGAELIINKLQEK